MQLTENQEKNKRRATKKQRISSSTENNEKKNHKNKRFLSKCVVYSTHYSYSVLIQPICGKCWLWFISQWHFYHQIESRRCLPNKAFLSLLLRQFDIDFSFFVLWWHNFRGCGWFRVHLLKMWKIKACHLRLVETNRCYQ